MELAVEGHLGQRLGTAQEIVLEIHHVVVQRLVGPHAVALGVLGEQHFAQPALIQQLLNLGLQVFRIAGEVFQ
jgi:hypothetical protein